MTKTNNETPSEAAAVEESDRLLSAAEMLPLLIQDLTSGEDPAIFAGEIIDNFVLVEQPESGQVLGLIEKETPVVLELIKSVVSHGAQETLLAIDRNGSQFIDEVKASLREQLSELAT